MSKYKAEVKRSRNVSSVRFLEFDKCTCLFAGRLPVTGAIGRGESGCGTVESVNCQFLPLGGGGRVDGGVEALGRRRGRDQRRQSPLLGLGLGVLEQVGRDGWLAHGFGPVRVAQRVHRLRHVVL